MADTKKDILKALDSFEYVRDKKQVFMDAVEFNALMLSIKTDSYRQDERLERAQSIYADYTQNERDSKNFEIISNGIHAMLKGMIDNFGDHLGEIYMAIAGDKNRVGQYFTPYDVSKMMAMITLGEPPTGERTRLRIGRYGCSCGGRVERARLQLYR